MGPFQFISISFIFLASICHTTPLLPRASSIATTDYDVLIVGGGPSGLSALSGLARVRRRATLIDSAEYRNGLTRHMHDVIGNDGQSNQEPDV